MVIEVDAGFRTGAWILLTMARPAQRAAQLRGIQAVVVRRAEAAAVSAIASGSQHNTIISNRSTTSSSVSAIESRAHSQLAAIPIGGRARPPAGWCARLADSVTIR